MMVKSPIKCLPIVVLVSGNGSNLQAIIDASLRDLPITIRAVICNRKGAMALQRAARANIPQKILEHNDFVTRESFDAELIKIIDSFRPALVVLAGFMRILSSGFICHYRDRILNIHPSLLPAYRGLQSHRRVLEAGEKQHGASVHLVTEELDGGQVLLQARVPVLPTDNVTILANRVLLEEHRIFPQVLSWFADQRIKRDASGCLLLDGKPLVCNLETATK